MKDVIIIKVDIEEYENWQRYRYYVNVLWLKNIAFAPLDVCMFLFMAICFY